MKLLPTKPGVVIACIIMALLLQGCGQKETAENHGESFAAARHNTETAEVAASKPPVSETPGLDAKAPGSEAGSSDGIPATALPSSPILDVPEHSSLPAASDKRVPPGKQPTGSPPPSAVARSKGKEVRQPGNIAAAPTAGVTSPSSISSSATSAEPTTPALGHQSITPPQHSAKPAAAEQAADKPNPDIAGTGAIGWQDFFDGEDQSRPSEQFWDLQGSSVTIRGFMGEVLSFEKHWFLLIPEPGAECPFDNGDETYWNKIMIVFVPDEVKLRYKSGPLQITGRLDVGIKIDESGYKTMFRLYDASFKEIE